MSLVRRLYPTQRYYTSRSSSLKFFAGFTDNAFVISLVGFCFGVHVSISFFLLTSGSAGGSGAVSLFSAGSIDSAGSAVSAAGCSVTGCSVTGCAADLLDDHRGIARGLIMGLVIVACGLS